MNFFPFWKSVYEFKKSWADIKLEMNREHLFFKTTFYNYILLPWLYHSTNVWCNSWNMWFWITNLKEKFHSSQFQRLCSTKSSSEMLQNLPYFIYIYENPKLLFPFFISCCFIVFPNECHGLCWHGKNNFGFSYM